MPHEVPLISLAAKLRELLEEENSQDAVQRRREGEVPDYEDLLDRLAAILKEATPKREVKVGDWICFMFGEVGHVGQVVSSTSPTLLEVRGIDRVVYVIGRNNVVGIAKETEDET